MKAHDLAQHYAQAAYQHTTQGWLGTLTAVRDTLTADPDLVAELGNAQVDFAQRQARLDAVLPPDAKQDVKNFLYLLLKDGHIGLLADVVADLTRLSTKRPGVRVARITSAIPLTPDEQKAFRQKISTQFGADVDFDFRVDPSILGGAIVQVGDKVIDGSLAGKLNTLHERLAAVR